MYEIVFYDDERGNEPVKEFIENSMIKLQQARMQG